MIRAWDVTSVEEWLFAVTISRAVLLKAVSKPILEPHMGPQWDKLQKLGIKRKFDNNLIVSWHPSIWSWVCIFCIYIFLTNLFLFHFAKAFFIYDELDVTKQQQYRKGVSSSQTVWEIWSAQYLSTFWFLDPFTLLKIIDGKKYFI